MLTNQMVMKDIMLYAYAVSKMYFCFLPFFCVCAACLSLPLSKICSLWSFFFLLNIMQNFACQKKSYTHTYTIPYQSTGPFQPRTLYDSMKSCNSWSYPDVILTLCKTKKHPVLEMHQCLQANHAWFSSWLDFFFFLVYSLNICCWNL